MKRRECEQLHETVVRDIVDVITSVKDFDEIDVEEFMREYGFRMRNQANKQMLAILSAQKEAVLNSGLSAEESDAVVKACMDPIGHIKKYSEEHPEFMEGRLLPSE